MFSMSIYKQKFKKKTAEIHTPNINMCLVYKTTLNIM